MTERGRTKSGCAASLRVWRARSDPLAQRPRGVVGRGQLRCRPHADERAGPWPQPRAQEGAGTLSASGAQVSAISQVAQRKASRISLALGVATQNSPRWTRTRAGSSSASCGLRNTALAQLLMLSAAIEGQLSAISRHAAKPLKGRSLIIEFQESVTHTQHPQALRPRARSNKT
jgi:hypothetical protein